MFPMRQATIIQKRILPINITKPQYYYSCIRTLSMLKNQEFTTTTTTNKILIDPKYCNVPQNISSKLNTNLHLKPNHPLSLIKTRIEEYWTTQYKQKHNPSTSSTKPAIQDNLSPIVSTYSNFDSLNIPSDHISRSKSDSYYYNPNQVLRTHTSAHQVDLLREGQDFFLVTGDVYRRDEIDACHYPVFHQMEGVNIFTTTGEDAAQEMISRDLKRSLEEMTQFVFGNVEMRWIDAYFPFTTPSYELEIFFNNEWLEVLGCGVIHPTILQNGNRDPTLESGWAFGLGLERLAMVLFSIPDIRLFWTKDVRFHDQFKDGRLDVTFEEYSKYPPCTKDISFWIPSSPNDSTTHTPPFHVNDLYEVIRDVVGDLVESVTLMDEFTHPKTKQKSLCFRISYRSMDRNLTNEEIDTLQEKVRADVSKKLDMILR